MTVTAYMQAIVMGTRTSRAPLNQVEGIETGGARKEEPTGGGGRVEGSLFGGNLKREEGGKVNLTLILSAWRISTVFEVVEVFKEVADFQTKKIRAHSKVSI